MALQLGTLCSLLVLGLVSCGSIIQLGDGSSLVNGILTCNGVQCPKDSDRCSVYETSQHSPNNATVTKKIECSDVRGSVLLSRNSSTANPSGKWVNNLAELSLTGGTFSCNGCAGDTPAEMKENYRKQMEEFERRMAEQMAELKQRMKEMEERLSHLRGGIFGGLK